jgi:hypothetical protein
VEPCFYIQMKCCLSPNSEQIGRHGGRSSIVEGAAPSAPSFPARQRGLKKSDDTEVVPPHWRGCSVSAVVSRAAARHEEVRRHGGRPSSF